MGRSIAGSGAVPPQVTPVGAVHGGVLQSSEVRCRVASWRHHSYGGTRRWSRGPSRAAPGSVSSSRVTPEPTGMHWKLVQPSQLWQSFRLCSVLARTAEFPNSHDSWVIPTSASSLPITSVEGLWTSLSKSVVMIDLSYSLTQFTIASHMMFLICPKRHKQFSHYPHSGCCVTGHVTWP